ncbi:hypothetical protein NliqN6_6870 [Naganishia liquefaciens]|uniref:Succinate dehydrogenase assembly factor 3 n=1 Tax=Naganishia liquefaciens TaxID=104408 RepID=A0A8H3U0Y9_9TREE|nr:hypothetical protein NliqN6_6870 [Naganishia liquefaciens]
MLATLVRSASSVSQAPLKLKDASAQLLPPIPLYRALLRSHRALPEEMRYIGDSYVKAEFRRTRGTDNPIHIIGFLSQWKVYLDEVRGQTGRASGKGARPFSGRPLNTEFFEKLSDEQAGQMYELMHATRDIWKTPDELEAQAVQQEEGVATEDRKTGKE